MLYIFTVFQPSQYFSVNFLYFELIVDSHCMYPLYPVYPSGNNILYGFLCGSVVKNPPAVQETQETWFHPWVRKIPWSRKWQPAPVFLPGKFREQRSLVGYSSLSRKELDMTEQLNTHTQVFSIF